MGHAEDTDRVRELETVVKHVLKLFSHENIKRHKASFMSNLNGD